MVTFKEAVEVMYARIQEENPHLKDVVIVNVTDDKPRGEWLCWKVHLSNGEEVPFELKMPQTAKH